MKNLAECDVIYGDICCINQKSWFNYKQFIQVNHIQGRGMNLYLVRHAAAIDRSHTIPEAYRYLTPEGRKAFRKSAKIAEKEGVLADLILSSPLIRAVQTADILAERIGYQGPVQIAEELSPGFEGRDLERLLATSASITGLALVGHEPDMGLLLAELLGIKVETSLKKGAIVSLTLEQKQGSRKASFNWLVTGGKVMTSIVKAFPAA
jgi:phosphohistidine phosphatase